MARRIASVITLLCVLAAAVTGCSQDEGPSITPKHPVALPPASAFSTPPHKGAQVGGLPDVSAGPTSSQQGAAAAPGGKKPGR